MTQKDGSYRRQAVEIEDGGGRSRIEDEVGTRRPRKSSEELRMKSVELDAAGGNTEAMDVRCGI
jgi:hypothetical protein